MVGNLEVNTRGTRSCDDVQGADPKWLDYDDKGFGRMDMLK